MPTRKNHQQEERFLIKLTNLNFKTKSKDFLLIDDSFCPGDGYQLQLCTGKAIFYTQENCFVNDISNVTKVIVITESLNVKLFWQAIPVPLPEWFRKGSDCRLKNKSTLDNFPSYIRSYAEQNTKKLQDELLQIKFKKPENGPKYSPQMLQFALILRYTSLPAYKLMK